MNFNALALFITILLGSLSQLILKSAFIPSDLATATQGSCNLWLICFAQNLATTMFGEVRLGILLGGLVTYVMATGFWILALRQFELGKAYAFLGFTYILVYLGSVFWPALSESVTWPKTIGVGMIVFGIFLISSKTLPRVPGWRRPAPADTTDSTNKSYQEN